MSFGNIRRICRDLLINGFTGSYVVPRSLRRILYQIFGYKIGKNCEIAPKCFFGHGHGTLVLGEDTFVNYRCQFDLGDDITVGDNCNIAMNVHFCTNSHEIGGRAGEQEKKYMVAS